MVHRSVFLLLLCGALAACGGFENRQNRQVTFEGLRFDANVQGGGDQGREMVVTVRPAAVNPGAALEAGRYEAVKYCIRTFGGSDAAWEVGPDTPVDQIRIVDDTITLVGRCTQPA